MFYRTVELMYSSAGFISSLGPKEANPAKPGPTYVPLRALPGLLQGGEGLQRKIQVPLQDEDVGECCLPQLFLFLKGGVCIL